MSLVALVYAISRNGVIGSAGGLPWKVSGDLKNFKAVTMGKPVIMGRKTWDSLPRKPLPGRLNIVISRRTNFRAEGGVVVRDVQAALEMASREKASEICVIGGAEIFRQMLPLASKIYLTEIEADVTGDVTFNALSPKDWHEISRAHHEAAPGDTAGFTFRVMERRS